MALMASIIFIPIKYIFCVKIVLNLLIILIQMFYLHVFVCLSVFYVPGTCRGSLISYGIVLSVSHQVGDKN